MGFGTEFVGPITMHRGRNIRSRYEENHPDFTPPNPISSSAQVPIFVSDLHPERHSRYEESHSEFIPPGVASRKEPPVAAVVHERGRKVGGTGRSLVDILKEQSPQEFFASLPQVVEASNAEKTRQARKIYVERKVSDNERKRSARAAKVESGRKQEFGPQERSNGNGTVVLVNRKVEVPRDQYRDPPAVDLPPAVELPRAPAPQESHTGYDTVGTPQIRLIENPQNTTTTVRDKSFEKFEPLSPPERDNLGEETRARAEQIQRSTTIDLEYHRELSEVKAQYDRQLAEQQREIGELKSYIQGLVPSIHQGFQNIEQQRQVETEAKKLRQAEKAKLRQSELQDLRSEFQASTSQMQAQYVADKKASEEKEKLALEAKRLRQAEKVEQMEAKQAEKVQRHKVKQIAQNLRDMQYNREIEILKQDVDHEMDARVTDTVDLQENLRALQYDIQYLKDARVDDIGKIAYTEDIERLRKELRSELHELSDEHEIKRFDDRQELGERIERSSIAVTRRQRVEKEQLLAKIAKQKGKRKALQAQVAEINRQKQTDLEAKKLRQAEKARRKKDEDIVLARNLAAINAEIESKRKVDLKKFSSVLNQHDLRLNSLDSSLSQVRSQKPSAPPSTSIRDQEARNALRRLLPLVQEINSSLFVNPDIYPLGRGVLDREKLDRRRNLYEITIPY